MEKAETHRTAALIALAVASMTSIRAGEEEQATLCRDDILHLCMATISDRSRIVSCLRGQRASLGPDCRTVFEEDLPGASGRHSAGLR